MSDLPDGWEWATFREVASVAADLVDPTSCPDARHVAPNHIESFTGRLTGVLTVAEDGVTSSKHRFRPDQILYSKIRPYLAKATIPGFAGVCSADMYPINSSIESRYLLNWMLSAEFTELAAGQQARSVLPKINRAALEKLSVPIAPSAEQERIVTAIEEAFSKLDAGEAGLKRAQKRLKSLRRSVLNDAVFGSGASATDALWENARVGDIASVVSGNTPRGLKGSLAASGDVPFVKVGDLASSDHFVTGSRTWLTSESCERLRIRVHPAGTIVFPKRGGAIATNRKRVLGTPAAFDLNTMGITPVEPAVGPWLWTWFLTLDLRSISDGSNIPQINHTDVAPLELPLPSPGEQERIVAEVERQMSFLDACERAVDVGLVKGAALRRSVLKAAFEGKLVEQDPTDEPASVLLERIREERASTPG